MITDKRGDSTAQLVSVGREGAGNRVTRVGVLCKFVTLSET